MGHPVREALLSDPIPKDNDASLRIWFNDTEHANLELVKNSWTVNG
jgi:hypothetical protein